MKFKVKLMLLSDAERDAVFLLNEDNIEKSKLRETDLSGEERGAGKAGGSGNKKDEHDTRKQLAVTETKTSGRKFPARKLTSKKRQAPALSRCNAATFFGLGASSSEDDQDTLTKRLRTTIKENVGTRKTTLTDPVGEERIVGDEEQQVGGDLGFRKSEEEKRGGDDESKSEGDTIREGEKLIIEIEDDEEERGQSGGNKERETGGSSGYVLEGVGSEKGTCYDPIFLCFLVEAIIFLSINYIRTCSFGRGIRVFRFFGGFCL